MAMFESKVEDQRNELFHSNFRNIYLKNKLKKLECEHKMLAEKIETSHIELNERKQSNQCLNNELSALKTKILENSQQLEQVNEHIKAILTVFREKKFEIVEDKTSNEDLRIKNEQIECMQAHLLKLRLKEAEKNAIIHKMRQIVRELERDNEMLKKRQPETISNLQSELMMAKRRSFFLERDFKFIKRKLFDIKEQLKEHLNAMGEDSNYSSNIQGITKVSSWSNFGVMWQSDKTVTNNEKNVHEIRIKQLENEQFYLKNKIPELRKQNELLTEQIKIKENIKAGLNDKIEGAKNREESNSSILNERKRQCDALENKGKAKFDGIKNSCAKKRGNIDFLAQKVDQLSNEASVENSIDYEVNIVLALEEKIQRLEEKIKQLQS